MFYKLSFLSIKYKFWIFFLVVCSFFALNKNLINSALADYHGEDNAPQVLVIELGDKTINKIAKILREMQTVELSNDTISKLKKINEIDEITVSLSSSSIDDLKNELVLSLSDETLEKLKSHQTISICDAKGENCTPIRSTGLSKSTYHRNKSN